MLVRPDAMQKVARSNFDAAIGFYGAAPKVLSAVTAELFDYSGRSLEDTMAGLARLGGAKTMRSMLEIQSELTIAAYRAFAAEATKIVELSVTAARDACHGLVGLPPG
jgi:hypothetical protein